MHCWKRAARLEGSVPQTPEWTRTEFQAMALTKSNNRLDSFAGGCILRGKVRHHHGRSVLRLYSHLNRSTRAERSVFQDQQGVRVT